MRALSRRMMKLEQKLPNGSLSDMSVFSKGGVVFAPKELAGKQLVSKGDINLINGVQYEHIVDYTLLTDAKIQELKAAPHADRNPQNS